MRLIPQLANQRRAESDKFVGNGSRFPIVFDQVIDPIPLLSVALLRFDHLATAILGQGRVLPFIRTCISINILDLG